MKKRKRSSIIKTLNPSQILMSLPPLPHLSLPLLLLLTISSIISILPSHSHQIQQNPHPIDRTIRDSAFLSLPIHIKTAVLYPVKLPLLPGVTADIARFRSGSLRRHGANINNFRLAPGSLNILRRPRRLFVVYQNLGSTYSSVYNVSGFRLVTPILGLLFYDDDVIVKKHPVEVNFSGVVCKTRRRELTCVWFLLDGRVRLSNLTGSGTCVAWGQGHFGLLVEVGTEVGGEMRWKVVMVMVLGGGFVAVLLGLVGVAMVKVRRKRGWVAEMERRAYEEEALQMAMVGHVRAPTATFARTNPAAALENDYYPCL